MMGEIPQQITEENFALYRQLHEAVMSGDTEAAAQIREQLGLGTGDMFRHGMPPGPPENDSMMHRRRMMDPDMRFVDRNGDGYCDFAEQEEGE